jgi:hypothetical protein
MSLPSTIAMLLRIGIEQKRSAENAGRFRVAQGDRAFLKVLAHANTG